MDIERLECGVRGTIARYNVNIEMYLAAALKFSAKSKQDRWLFRRRQLGVARGRVGSREARPTQHM